MLYIVKLVSLPLSLTFCSVDSCDKTTCKEYQRLTVTKCDCQLCDRLGNLKALLKNL